MCVCVYSRIYVYVIKGYKCIYLYTYTYIYLLYGIVYEQEDSQGSEILKSVFSVSLIKMSCWLLSFPTSGSNNGQSNVFGAYTGFIESISHSSRQVPNYPVSILLALISDKVTG
jgi:hypothetical protein